MTYNSSGVCINNSNEKAKQYLSYRTEKFDLAIEFQDYVIDLAWNAGLVISTYSSKKYQLEKGEGRAGVEIKYDMLLKKYNNIYIETAEKGMLRDGPFVPSGIYSSGHWLYAIGDYEVVYVIPTNLLRILDSDPKWERKVKETSMGFVIPREKAEKFAALILRAK